RRSWIAARSRVTCASISVIRSKIGCIASRMIASFFLRSVGVIVRHVISFLLRCFLRDKPVQGIPDLDHLIQREPDMGRTGKGLTVGMGVDVHHRLILGIVLNIDGHSLHAIPAPLLPDGVSSEIFSPRNLAHGGITSKRHTRTPPLMSCSPKAPA